MGNSRNVPIWAVSGLTIRRLRLHKIIIHRHLSNLETWKYSRVQVLKGSPIFAGIRPVSRVLFNTSGDDGP
jgi:hypothetical protein